MFPQRDAVTTLMKSQFGDEIIEIVTTILGTDDDVDLETLGNDSEETQSSTS